MNVNTNQDFKKWIATLTPDQKKFNFNKVYQVLRRVDKEDKVRHCVKQLAIDWRVNVTRLTEEQLRPYGQIYNRTNAISSSSTETINEEVWNVLDECSTDDETTGGPSQNINTGKDIFKDLPKDETLQISQKKENTLQNNENHYDPTDIKVNAETHQPTLDNNLKDTNNFDSLSKNNSSRSTVRKNSTDFTIEKINCNAEFSNNHTILSDVAKFEDIDNAICETVLSSNENLNNTNNCTKEIQLIGITPVVRTSCEISENNVKINVSKEDSSSDNDSNHDTLFNDSRVIIDKNTTVNSLSTVLIEDNALGIKSENKDFIEGAINENYLITKKNTINQEEGLEEEKIFPDESSCSDDGDFESAARGLEEVLENSEEYVTSIQIDSKLKTVKMNHLLVSQECLELHQPRLQGEINDSSAGSCNDLHYSANFDDRKNDHEEISEVTCKDNVKITLSNIPVLSEDLSLCQTSKTSHAPLDEANFSERTINFQNSEIEEEIAEDGVESLIGVDEEELMIHTSTYSEKPQDCKTQRLELSQKQSNFSSTNKHSEVDYFTCCIPKETRYFKININICKEEENKFNILDSITDTKLLYDEKSLVKNWWSKYQRAFLSEKTCHSLHYSEGIFNYDSETWPDISFEPERKQDEVKHFGPEKLHIDSLLSEMEDLEREKNMIYLLQESTSESELEAVEDISDDESLPLASEMKETTNLDPLLISNSNLLSSITTDQLDTATPFHGSKLRSFPAGEPPIYPPLPSYPPPRTPSPPPIPSLSVDASQPDPSCSLSSLVLPSNPQEEKSNCIFNIPLPSSAPALPRLETEESILQHSEIVRQHNILEPLSSTLITSTLNEHHQSPNLDLSLDSTLVHENKHFGFLHQQNTVSIPQTTTQESPQLNSKPQLIIVPQVLPPNETLNLKQPSVRGCKSNSETLRDLTPTKEISSFLESPSQIYIKSSSPLAEVKTTLPSVAASTSLKSHQNFAERNMTDAVNLQKLAQKNVTTQEKNDILLDRSTVSETRKTIREKNLFFLKYWKSKVKRAEIKVNMKKPRKNKPYKVSSRINNSLSPSKIKSDYFKKNNLFGHLCHKTNNADSTFPSIEVNKYSPNDDDCKVLAKGDLNSDNKSSLLLNNLPEGGEETYDNDTTPGMELKIEEETSMDIVCSTSVPFAVQHSEDISTSLATKDIGEGLVPKIVSVMSTATNKQQLSPKASEQREFKNEENKSWQFVDESIPGDPIACKYVEDEENIEVLFEPVTNNSNNIDFKIESSTLSSETPDTEMSSPGLNIDLPNKNCLLSDLQVSSSADESEEDFYVRPRIINGFGHPFIIPHSQDKNNFSVLPSENAESPHIIKIEETSKVTLDNEKMSNNLSEENMLEKVKDDKLEALKSPTHRLERSKQSLFQVNGPVIIGEKYTGNNTDSTVEKSPEKSKDNITSKSSKQRKNPLKPKNQIVTANKASGEKTKCLSTCKDKNMLKNGEKHRSDKHKQKGENSPSKTNSRENHRSSQVTHRNTKPSVKLGAFQDKQNKSKSSIHSNTETTQSHFQLSTHERTVSTKDKGDTCIKNNQKTVGHGFLPIKPIQKENTTYQPSGIRKKLISEVENIILIKKDVNKNTKPQIRNESAPLKRANSLPEVPSVKAVNPVSHPTVNPVLDAIVNDMNASPPPKSLIIKETETQKYVAEPYWFNSTSTNNLMHAKESSLQNNDLKNQTKCVPYERQSANKNFTKGNLQQNNTFKRSVSLNSDSIDKKEKNSKPPLKQIESISDFKRSLSKIPFRSKRSTEHFKKACSDKYLENKQKITNCEKAKNQDVPQKDESNLASVTENRSTRKSLPSMPSIEIDNSTASSSEKQIEIVCKALTCKEKASNAVSTSKNVQSHTTPFFEINKPSLKVSIPIIHFNSLHREHAVSASKKNKSRSAGETFFKSDNKVNNEVRYITSDGAQKRSNDKTNNLTQEKTCLQNSVDLNKVQIGHNNIKKRPSPNESAQNSHDITIGNSNLSRRKRNNPNLLKVAAKKEQGKVCVNESVTSSRSCLKRSSNKLKSKSRFKQQKLSLPNLDSLDHQHENVTQAAITSSALPSYSDKGKYLILHETHSSDNVPSTLSCNANEDNSNLKCEESEQIILNLLPCDEESHKVLKADALNDIQISIPQINGKQSDNSRCNITTFNFGESSKNSSSTLRIKHPSLLQSQTSANVDLGPQHVPRRRISVLSPEVLSSGVQANDQENNKRHTWYMEPEKVDTDVSSLPNQYTNDSHCKTISLFSNLFMEPNRKTELINKFKMSVKIGKKEYEQIHDVIKCIELDYKQKQDVIESVKKLQSRDVVQQEIKRATTEYEKKLAERESYFRKTFNNLLDHFKDATDCIHLAFYVFLSQKVEYLCSESALKHSVLTLLKRWIRNDYNKHIFDQDDIAFSNDCDIMLKILKEIESFSLLLTGVENSPMNPAINGVEDTQAYISSQETNSRRNCANSLITSSTNKDAVQPSESGVSSVDNMIEVQSEPQFFTSDSPQVSVLSRSLSEGVGQMSNSQSKECPQPFNEISTVRESGSSMSASVSADILNSFGNTIPTQNQIFSLNSNESPGNRGSPILSNVEVTLPIEARTTPMSVNQMRCTSASNVENELLLSSQEISQQATYIVPGNPVSISQSTIAKNQQPQFLAQPVSQQTQELANTWNASSDRTNPLRRNNLIPEVPLRENASSSIHHTRHQIQTNHPLSTPLVVQTATTIDKYQNMRKGNAKNMINHTINSMYRGQNSTPQAIPSVTRHTVVVNESSLRSLSSSQNIEPFVYGVQSGTPQPLPTVFPHLQNVQNQEIQHNPINLFNQNNETERVARRSQPSYQQYPHTGLRTGQTIQPMNRCYPVQPSQHQVAQYIKGKNTTQQLNQENIYLKQKKVINNIYANQVANPHPVQYATVNTPNYSQSFSQNVNLPTNQQQKQLFPSNNSRSLSQDITWQNFYQPQLENQFIQNTDTSQIGDINNISAFPKDQNISYQVVNIQNQISQNSFMVHNKDGAHLVNRIPDTTETRHVTSQILQSDAQIVSVKHVPSRRFSNDDKSKQSVKRPSNQSSYATENPKRQCHYQHNPSINQFPGNRRSSIETTQPSQHINTNSSSNHLLGASMFSEKSINDQSQRSTVYFNDTEDQTVAHTESRRKSNEIAEQVDLSCVTEADLDNLFSKVDDKTIEELMKSIEFDNVTPGQANYNPNNASRNIQTPINNVNPLTDGTIQSASLNIENDSQFTQKLPDRDSNFIGVNIAGQQAYLGGKDHEITLIGERTTAGQSFTQNESTSSSALNAQKLKDTYDLEKRRSNLVLIQMLKATAFKDVASYIKIIEVLKRLAINDNDAQQAVQEMVYVLKLYMKSKQTDSSSPVIVIDD